VLSRTCLRSWILFPWLMPLINQDALWTLTWPTVLHNTAFWAVITNRFELALGSRAQWRFWLWWSAWPRCICKLRLKSYPFYILSLEFWEGLMSGWKAKAERTWLRQLELRMDPSSCVNFFQSIDVMQLSRSHPPAGEPRRATNIEPFSLELT